MFYPDQTWMSSKHMLIKLSSSQASTTHATWLHGRVTCAPSFTSPFSLRVTTTNGANNEHCRTKACFYTCRGGAPTPPKSIESQEPCSARKEMSCFREAQLTWSVPSFATRIVGNRQAPTVDDLCRDCVPVSRLSRNISHALPIPSWKQLRRRRVEGRWLRCLGKGF